MLEVGYALPSTFVALSLPAPAISEQIGTVWEVCGHCVLGPPTFLASACEHHQRGISSGSSSTPEIAML